jgi:hypothetical protein
MLRKIARRGLTLFILVFAVTAFGGTTDTAASPQRAPVATQIRAFRAYSATGKLAGGLHVLKTLTGSCWEGSIVDTTRRDAWRCLAVNLIYDPCFQPPNTRKPRLLACSTAPWLSEVTMLRLSQPLPYSQANRGSSPNEFAWALVLRNGGHCVRFGGATGTIAGMGISYGCSNGNGLNEIHRNKQPWTIFFVKPGSKTPRQVAVSVAWY